MHSITCFVFFVLNLSHCARLPGYFRLALFNGLCVLRPSLLQHLDHDISKPETAVIFV